MTHSIPTRRSSDLPRGKKGAHGQKSVSGRSHRAVLSTELWMIPELGHFALILALAVAVVQGSLPAIGAARQSDSLMAVAGPAAVAQFLLVGTALDRKSTRLNSSH